MWHTNIGVLPIQFQIILSDKIKNVNNKKSILQHSPIYAYQSIRFDEIFYVLYFSSPNLSSFSVNFKKIEQITFLDFSNIFYRYHACKFLILLVLCVYFWNLFYSVHRKKIKSSSPFQKATLFTNRKLISWQKAFKFKWKNSHQQKVKSHWKQKKQKCESNSLSTKILWKL